MASAALLLLSRRVHQRPLPLLRCLLPATRSYAKKSGDESTSGPVRSTNRSLYDQEGPRIVDDKEKAAEEAYMRRESEKQKKDLLKKIKKTQPKPSGSSGSSTPPPSTKASGTSKGRGHEEPDARPIRASSRSLMEGEGPPLKDKEHAQEEAYYRKKSKSQLKDLDEKLKKKKPAK